MTDYRLLITLKVNQTTEKKLYVYANDLNYLKELMVGIKFGSNPVKKDEML